MNNIDFSLSFKQFLFDATMSQHENNITIRKMGIAFRNHRRHKLC